MAASPNRPTPSDAETFEARRRSDEAVIRLLHSWGNQGDPEEQRETLAYLMQALDEDRPSSRELFPGGSSMPRSHSPRRGSPRPDHQPRGRRTRKGV